MRHRALMAAGGGAAFDPLSLSPVAWWDCSDAATITKSGGYMTAFNDKSTSGWNLTSSYGTGFSIDAYTKNGLSVAHIPLNNNTMQKTSGVSMSGASYTVAAVFCSDNANGNRLISMGGATGVDFEASGFYFGQGSGPTILNYQAKNLSSAAISAGTWYIALSVSNGTNNTLYLNGTGQTPVAVTSALGTTKIRIGQYVGAANNQWNGKFGEILIFPSALGATDRTALTGYLNTKWAVY